MELSQILFALAVWLAILGSGRLLLSWLPPGRIGGHAPAELPATLAASFACGLTVLGAFTRWVSLLGPGFPAWAALSGLLVAALLALAARIATLPAAFVPGPLDARGRAAAWHLVLRWTAAVAICARFAPALLELEVLGATPWIGALAAPAAALLIDEALRGAGARQTVRSLVWAALAALVWTAPRELLHARVIFAALLAAGGASSLDAWWRRADRRAGALAALLFAAQIAVLPPLWWLGSAGLAVLVLWTSAGGRAAVLAASLGSLAVLVAPLPIQRALLDEERLRWVRIDSPSHLGLGTLVLPTLAALSVLGLGLLLSASRRAPRVT